MPRAAMPRPRRWRSPGTATRTPCSRSRWSRALPRPAASPTPRTIAAPSPTAASARTPTSPRPSTASGSTRPRSPMSRATTRRGCRAEGCRAEGWRAELAPVIDHPDAGPRIARLVGPVHGHALDRGPEAAAPQMCVGFDAAHVGASHQVRHAGLHGERLAGIDQPVEVLAGPRGAELDQAGVGARLAGRAVVADREAGHARVVGDQDRVAQAEIAH